MAMNKRKATTAVAAGATALALLLGGTFAWVSISQQAKNEATGIVNVGGRLHDDFNGTNKDVYVENFTDGTNGGQPIYARIKLTEYMEVGKEAGKVGADGQYDPNRNAASVIAGADINDPDSWSVHKPIENCAECYENGTPCVFHSHWEWEMGGSTTFMPTFNKDKDSLEADINGTYHGTDATDKIYYDDYVEYTTDETNTEKVYSETDTARYDNDPDTDKNVTEGQYTTKEETHYAKETATAEVITMQEWKDTYNSQPGNYWVYDADGWAYWANPIMPGEATGLLLTEINMYKNPGEKCYYAINVVGQFATVGDWELFGVDEEDPDYPSEDAIALLTKASQNVPTVTVTNVNGKTLVMRGDTVTFSATTAVGAAATLADSDEYEWSVLDENRNPVTSSTIQVKDDGTATLTVGSAETNPGLYVAARSKSTGAVGLSAVAVQLYTVTITEENDTSVVVAGNTLNFTATVVESNTGNAETSGVTWKLTGAQAAGTTINTNGVLTIDTDEPGANVLTVTATSATGGFIAEYKVTVADKYGVTVSATGGETYVDPGKTLTFDVVVMKNGVEDTASGVNWTVTGGNGTAKIDENGVLTVDASENGGTELTVTATSKTDNTASGTYKVTVNKYAVTISQANNATTIDAGKTLQFIAAVKKNDTADSSGVTWSVSGADGVAISEDGVLSVPTSVMNGTSLTVTATSKEDGKVSSTKTVTVNAVYALTINPSSQSVDPGQTIQYEATLSVNGITEQTNAVTWSVTDSNGNAVSNATMEPTGMLTVNETTYDSSSLKITAVHNSTNATASTTATVNYTLTLESTGTFTLDGLRVDVVEPYYSTTDLTAAIADNTGDTRYNYAVSENDDGVYLMITHDDTYYEYADHGTRTLTVTSPEGKTASLSFACNSHENTAYTVEYSDSNGSTILDCTDNTGWKYFYMNLRDGSGNLVGSEKITWSAKSNTGYSYMLPDFNDTLSVRSIETSPYVTVTYRTENAWGTKDFRIRYAETDAVQGMYLKFIAKTWADNLDDFAAPDETVTYGEKRSSFRLGYGPTYLFRVYDADGNVINEPLNFTIWQGDINITGSQSGYACTNGYSTDDSNFTDEDGGIYWIWVPQGNTTELTFWISYVNVFGEVGTFEATVW